MGRGGVNHVSLSNTCGRKDTTCPATTITRIRIRIMIGHLARNGGSNSPVTHRPFPAEAPPTETRTGMGILQYCDPTTLQQLQGVHIIVMGGGGSPAPAGMPAPSARFPGHRRMTHASRRPDPPRPLRTRMLILVLGRVRKPAGRYYPAGIRPRSGPVHETG